MTEPAAVDDRPDVLGSPTSRRLCLRFVLKDPIAFREHFVPRVSKRRFWHRLTFSTVLLGTLVGDTLLAAGRGTGKSYSVLEPHVIQPAISRPGEETLVTSLRKAHVIDRMERAIDYIEEIPFFRLFLERITRSPYIIELKNGHKIYGINVGDDPEARMAQGKHASTMILEETHQYPLRAWLKIQGAKDPRGCNVLMVGVPDGRTDTPFRLADSRYASFRGRTFHISRRTDPYFTQATKRQLADQYGGEDSDLFKGEVDAEWGNPVWSAWDLDAIYRCFTQDIPPTVLRISGKAYLEQALRPNDAISDLPGRLQGWEGRCIVAADIGYTQPTSVGVFILRKDRWYLVARVELTNRMEHDTQALIIDAVAARYGAEAIAIDATEGEGRAICQQLEQTLLWAPRFIGNQMRSPIFRIVFNETYLAEYLQDPATQEVVEVWESAREIGTRQLRAMFGKLLLALPVDEDIPTEFNQEKETKTGEGKLKVVTPSTVHITDMMRVFAVALFIETPPMPPNLEPETEFCLPEWGAGTPWRG